MKLKNKLILSFCIMIILPLVLCGILVSGIFKIQIYSLQKAYGIDDSDVTINSMYSPVVLFGSITDNIYGRMSEVADKTPLKFNDEKYLDELSKELDFKLSDLVVRKNDVITYNTTDMGAEEIDILLPAFYDNGDEIYNNMVFKGDGDKKLIKQIDFKDYANNKYSVSIITNLNQVVPQLQTMFVDVAVSIIGVLVLTSALLSFWIYSSIVRPVNRLKLATANIKEGNLDFTMPKVPSNEIGEVCSDFEEMRLILKETSEAKIKSDVEEKELIRNISHDLKTPLTAIKGYAMGLIDGVADTPEKQQKYIRTIYSKANDMDKLIDELTIYSRLDNNRVPYTFVRINVSDYFNDCSEEIGMELEADDFKLNYNDHLKEPVYVNLDPEQIKRVVNNIVSNSVKYKAENRPGVISIDLYDDGDYVHLVFRDNGKGIAAKDIERIFERFYRTDDSRNSKQGGSGIGLAIVKKIVEDHKGKIWAESVEGEGTTMHLELIKADAESQYFIEDKQKKSKN